MQNNLFKTFLKIWIAFASVIAFLFGWVTFAHSGKPVSASSASLASNGAQSVQIQPLPTLQPLPPLGSTQSQPVQPQQLQPIQPQTFNFIPQMRTRGS